MIYHCPMCGHSLTPVPEDNGLWYDLCRHFMDTDGTSWFLCTNGYCIHSNLPLVLHHPVYGWRHPADDSWAISWVK